MKASKYLLIVWKVSKRLQEQRKLWIAFWPVPRPRNLSRNWKFCVDCKKWSLTSLWMSYGKVAALLQKSKEIWELRSCMCQDQRSFPWRNFTLITRNEGQRVLECQWKSCHKVTEDQRNRLIAVVPTPRRKNPSQKLLYAVWNSFNKITEEQRKLEFFADAKTKEPLWKAIFLCKKWRPTSTWTLFQG